MGSSGVVTLVIVAMWSTYLVPRWLRRHDLTSESRSVDRFSRAMRTLSRRTPTPDRRYVLRPAPARGVPLGVAARRRQVLGALLTLAVVGLVGSSLHLVSWLLPAGTGLLLIGYVAHLRVQTRTAREVAARRLAAERRAASRARREQRIPRAGSAVPDLEMVSAAGVLFAEDPLEAVLDLRVDSSWAPVPVPLPTYVTAPKAVRRPVRSSRVIDLTQPGAWAQGHRVDEPVPVVPAFELSLSSAHAPDHLADDASDHLADDASDHLADDAAWGEPDEWSWARETIERPDLFDQDAQSQDEQYFSGRRAAGD